MVSKFGQKHNSPLTFFFSVSCTCLYCSLSGHGKSLEKAVFCWLRTGMTLVPKESLLCSIGPRQGCHLSPEKACCIPLWWDRVPLLWGKSWPEERTGNPTVFNLICYLFCFYPFLLLLKSPNVVAFVVCNLSHKSNPIFPQTSWEFRFLGPEKWCMHFYYYEASSCGFILVFITMERNLFMSLGDIVQL